MHLEVVFKEAGEIPALCRNCDPLINGESEN